MFHAAKATTATATPIKTAMKIGKPVFRSMMQNSPKYISSDCQLSGHHIEQGIREGQFGDAKPELAHPITLIAKAYGLN